MKTSISNHTTAAMKRASNRQWMLKPQDFAVAMKLVVLGKQWLPYAELGESMRLSRYEVHAAVQRLMVAGLVVEIDGLPRVFMAAFRMFVLYGARYAFPPVRGGQTIGFPTAHGVAPLKQIMMIADSEPVPVWPHPKGIIRGQMLLPLFEKLPLAAVDDQPFYELLALFDALRIGQARERNLAAKLLEERLR